MLLGRSILPLDAARIAARILSQSANVGRLQEVLSSLRKAGSTASVRRSQTQENAGGLVASLLIAVCAQEKDNEIKGVEFGDIVIPGLDLGTIRIRDSRLINVEFRRANLASARFENCVANGVTIIEATVDPAHTRLELKGLDIDQQVIGLQIIGAGGSRVTYDPQKIRGCLRQIGVPGIEDDEPSGVRAIPEDLVELMERFARAYLRSNPLCTADFTFKKVFGDSRWPKIQDLLIKAGVVTEEYRPTKGHSPKLFLRRQVLPEEILLGLNRNAPAPPLVRKFWESLEAVYGKKIEGA